MENRTKEEISLFSHRVDTGGMQDLEAVEQELYHQLSESRGTIRTMCRHILGAGGKRIRPLLVLRCGRIFDAPEAELLKAAAASELIHMASLVHDDIIDHAPVRRSRVSVNKKWGNHFAVLCGDFLFARAFGILAENGLLESLHYMVEAISHMCQGEILQAESYFNCDTSVEDYYNRIAKKTAFFVACCCKSGVAVAGAEDECVEIMGRYGLQLGYAFQIIDDIMDLYGNEKTMGKPRGEDLNQGILTLPLLLLLHDGKDGKRIQQMIEERQLTEGNLIKISMMLEEKGIIRQCYEIAAEHILQAKNCICLLPASDHTRSLESLADMLQTRMN